MNPTEVGYAMTRPFRPFSCAVAGTDTASKQPTQPQYIATLRWDLEPRFDSNQFTFNAPEDAVRIKFARVKK
jgi:hypothetical protein